MPHGSPPSGTPVVRDLVIATILVLIGLALWYWSQSREPEAAREVEETEVAEEPAPGPPPDTIPVAPAPEPEDRRVPDDDIAGFERRTAERLRREPAPTEPIREPVRVRVTEVVREEAPGAPRLRAEAVTARVRIGAAIRGEFVVEEVRVEGLVADFGEAPGEAGALVNRLLGPGTGRDGPSPRVVLDRVTVRNARLDFRFAGERYVLSDLNVVLSRIAFGVPDEPPTAHIEELSTQLALTEAGVRRRITLDDARLQQLENRIQFRVGRFAFGASVFTGLEGSLAPDAPGLGLQAELRAAPLEFSDVQFLFPDLPPEGTATFRLAIAPRDGPGTRLRFRELTVRAAESVARGSIGLLVGLPDGPRLQTIDVQVDPLAIRFLERFIGPIPYGGTLTGRIHGTARELSFDLRGRFTTPDLPEPFPAQIVGRAAFGPEGFVLQALDLTLQEVPLATLRILAPGLPLRGVVTGRISIQGEPGRAPLFVDVQVALADGTARITGTIDPSGPVLSYDLSGQLSRISLQALLEPDLPPVRYTGPFSLEGAGTDPESATARLRLGGRLTGWVTQPGDSLVTRAALASGRLQLGTARVAAGPVRFRAQGDWRFVAPSTGEIRYRLVIQSLEPLGPYLPGVPDAPTEGLVRTAGRLSGTLDRPRVQGEAEGEALRYAAWRIGDAVADYTVAFEDPVPRGSITAEARRIVTPTAGAYDAAQATFELTPPRFALEIEADRADAGVWELAADGRILEDAGREALLRRFRVELDGSDWALDRPARIRWGDVEGVVVRNFRLAERDGDGHVVLDGAVPPVEADASLRIDIAALPVGDILRFLGRDTTVTGTLWAEGTLRGPGAAPDADLAFRLIGATVEGVPIDRIRGDLRYGARRLTSSGTIVVDTLRPDGGSVEYDASVPLALTLDLPPSADLVETGDMRLTLDTERFPLQILGELRRDIQDVEGYVTGRATVTGTPDRPRLDGTLYVREGAVTVQRLNQRYTQISSDIVLSNRRAVIEDLRARSDGWATATGEVRFENLTRPLVDARVQFEEFRAVGVDDFRDAGLWGEIQIAGPIRDPIVTGDLTVNEGGVPLPDRGRGDSFGGGLEPVGDVAFAAPAGPDGLDELPGDRRRIPIRLDDLELTAGDDLWFITSEGRLQLSGDLTVTSAGDQVRVFGTLRGDRGTFVIRAGPVVRRLDIVRAEVQFFGTPDINPALDITASRLVFTPAGERVEILLRVEGTLDRPVVAVSTADGTAVAESELLSFLVFGQPSFALEEGAIPGESLFLAGLADIASLELEQALVGDVGVPLDIFQIRPGRGALGGLGTPSLVLGTEIVDDVFLTLETGLFTLFGPGEADASTWALTLQWRIDSEWTLDLGFEPVHRQRGLRGIGPLIPIADVQRQIFIELRRRWTY